MTDLLNRLENADGADRELDKQIWQLLVPDVTRRTSHVAHHSKPYDIDETRDASGRLIIVPSYTVSLDAALALVKEVMGEVEHGVDYMILRGEKGWRAYVGVEREGAAWSFTDGAPLKSNPALAILIALLKAQETLLHATGEGDG